MTAVRQRHGAAAPRTRHGWSTLSISCHVNWRAAESPVLFAH
jgi:hypothetical protein